MRKLAKVLLAMTVVMSMGLTAIAAGSTTTSYEVKTATDANGNAVALEVTLSSDALPQTAVDSLGLDIDVATSTVILHEITAPEGTTFPLTITLSVSGVTSDMVVYILHYADDDGDGVSEWQEEACTVGDGTVTFTVNSLSPVAVVVTGETVSTDSTTSPETGEASTMAIVMLAGIALGTACVVSRKKVA